MFDNERFSLIIRTVDHRYDLLDKALFSVFCNTYPDKEAVIVYQGVDDAYYERLCDFQQLYPELPMLFLQNPTQVDQRARNLNLGIEQATGRYLGVLDDDDLLYPDHANKLIRALAESERAWVFSQTVIHNEENGYLRHRDFRYTTEGYYYTDLLKDNFIPTCSFIIDREQVQNPSLLTFDESMTRLEDYAFLLRLAYYYEPLLFPFVTNIYCIRTDGSNSNFNLYDSPDAPLSEKAIQEKVEWEKARQRIQFIKKRILMKTGV